jgi:hypothetical protein
MSSSWMCPLNSQAAAPRLFRDLRPTEQLIFVAMRTIGYGRFESVPIQNGLMVIDPWPKTVREVKFNISGVGHG